MMVELGDGQAPHKRPSPTSASAAEYASRANAGADEEDDDLLVGDGMEDADADADVDPERAGFRGKRGKRGNRDNREKRNRTGAPGPSRLRRCFLLLLVLGFVGVLAGSAEFFGLATLFSPVAPLTTAPSAAPTSAPTLEILPTRRIPTMKGWAETKEGHRVFDLQRGTCYFANIIRRVNNRPGSNLNCYAACTGLNLHLRDTQKKLQCVGWTMVLKRFCGDEGEGEGEGEGGGSNGTSVTACDEDTRGTNTCLLHHTFEKHASSYVNPSCVSGRLRKADLAVKFDAKADANAKADAEGTGGGSGASGGSGSEPEDGGGVSEDGVFVPAEAEDEADAAAAAASALRAHAERFNETCPARVAKMGPRPKRPMRVFIACVQASGCTLLSYLLAQRDKTTSILDLGVRQLVPEDAFYARAEAAYPLVDMIVLKHPVPGLAAALPADWLHDVEAKFRPDVKLLFLRNPLDSFLHLVNHIGKKFDGKVPSDERLGRCEAVGGDADSYGLACGTPESKLRALDILFSQREALGFDEVVTYEEVCNDRAALQRKLARAGVCVAEKDIRQPKWSVVDVMRYSYKYFLSGRMKNHGVFWGPGDLRNTFHDADGFQNTEHESFRLCRLETSNRIRAKLLQQSISPYYDMTLTDVQDNVNRYAPHMVKHYEDSKI